MIGDPSTVLALCNNLKDPPSLIEPNRHVGSFACSSHPMLEHMVPRMAHIIFSYLRVPFHDARMDDKDTLS